MSSCVESENGRSSNYDRSSSCNDIGTGRGDNSHEELWHACAGPLAYVPKAGETVYYFPQGHIDQVEAYTNHDGDMEMPIYKLPPKILCKVVSIQLKAEIHTDEVFAQVTLLPEAKQDEVNSNCKTPPMPPRVNSRFVVKILTQSDTGTHGGCSLPKRPADECLPSLDKSQHPPVQDLVTKDLHGNEWCFRHVYRGKPKRHLLTRGWSDFLTSKKLVPGDACIILRGRDGDVRIGVRRLMNSQTATPSFVLSGHSMRHGILASALHAVSAGTTFTVYYRPWACTSAFIIAYEQYVKAMANDYFIGKRFRMQFEDEKCGEQRLGGAVVGIEDIDQMRWPGSDWRCIKVLWDSTRAKCIRPERVSPWDIEPLDADAKKQPVLPTSLKRTRPHNLPSHWPPIFVMDGTQWTSVAPKSRRHLGVFQGQEKSDLPIYESNAPRPLPLVPRLPTPIQHVQLASQGDGGKRESQGPSNHGPPACIAPECGPVKSLSAQDISPANSTSQARMTSETKDETTPSQTNRFGKCMVFGVNIADDASELPSPQVANSSELSKPSSVPPLSKSSHFVQVIINGTATGRPVDLRQLKGYEELIHGLDQMFNFGGNLIDGSSGWHVKCMDDDGDNVPIGDYTWQELVSMVQQILICPKEEEKGKQVRMLERTVMVAKLGSVGVEILWTQYGKISCSRTLVLTNDRNLRIVGFPDSYY
ncbi:auxin response factor 2A-like isoform X2 [Syzygium oleosum]|uniref:auxin response factor 2A-like isoform X2 n=1 Tax=Syzygium oleosum TaxID=219896 RepID=UPI0024B91B7F|nr:auxin response factor 2A-like isoform X2 [Syzygium oleosum]